MSGLLTGISILVIGASQFAHTGTLTSTLQDGLLSQGASVAPYGVCASVPKSWVVPQRTPCGTAVRVQNGAVLEDHSPAATGGAVSDLIHRYHPQIVVIGIADTLAGYTAPQTNKAWVTDQVRTLGKTFAKVKAASDLLSTLVAPCEYLESLKMESPGQWPTSDGQHHMLAGYRLCADAASQAIMETDAVKSPEKPEAAKP